MCSKKLGKESSACCLIKTKISIQLNLVSEGIAKDRGSSSLDRESILNRVLDSI